MSRHDHYSALHICATNCPCEEIAEERAHPEHLSELDQDWRDSREENTRDYWGAA